VIARRPSDERGLTRLEWLESRHTFSFGDYRDPRFMGFGVLRVINEDWVAPRSGFAPHFHRDMEILTVVLEGTLRHEDSTGARHEVRPGLLQRMTAGTGIVHSEMNPSPDARVHLLQIWILPQARGLPPSYEEKSVGEAGEGEPLLLLASRDGRHGSLTIHQDASVLRARLAEGERAVHPLGSGRRAWAQVAAGTVELGRVRLDAGDGAAVREEKEISLRAVGGRADVLLFDLP
jgi:hypothetical protein